MIHTLLLLATLLVGVGIAFEIRRWKSSMRMVSRRQKLYRVLAAVVLESILVMILLSRTSIMRADPIFVLSYWGLAIALAFGLVVIALLDMKEGLNAYTERRRAMFHGLLGEERDDK